MSIQMCVSKHVQMQYCTYAYIYSDVHMCMSELEVCAGFFKHVRSMCKHAQQC